MEQTDENEFEDDELEWALLNDPSLADAFQEPFLDLTKSPACISPHKRARVSETPKKLADVLRDSRSG
jgi:hypothetical protein